MTDNKPLFFAIQGSYAHVQIALFLGEQVLLHRAQSDMRASSHLVPFLHDMLEQHGYAISDLDFIAVNKGPGAFTSLRATIATVNGIGFAQKLPVIGVAGLDALAYDARSVRTEKVDIVVPLLNAYNNDVYYGIYVGQECLERGAKNIELFCQGFQPVDQQKILFIGNVIQLHQAILIKRYGAQAMFEECLAGASAQSIGQLGLAMWRSQSQRTYKIIPEYLKTQLFAIKK